MEAECREMYDLWNDNGKCPPAAMAQVSVNVVPPIPDADEDGVADGEDNCPNVCNPDQTDRDADGVGGDCECAAANLDGIDPVNIKDFGLIADTWRATGPTPTVMTWSACWTCCNCSSTDSTVVANNTAAIVRSHG